MSNDVAVKQEEKVFQTRRGFYSHSHSSRSCTQRIVYIGHPHFSHAPRVYRLNFSLAFANLAIICDFLTFLVLTTLGPVIISPQHPANRYHQRSGRKSSTSTSRALTPLSYSFCPRSHIVSAPDTWHALRSHMPRHALQRTVPQDMPPVSNRRTRNYRLRLQIRLFQHLHAGFDGHLLLSRVTN